MGNLDQYKIHTGRRIFRSFEFWTAWGVKMSLVTGNWIEKIKQIKKDFLEIKLIFFVKKINPDLMASNWPIWPDDNIIYILGRSHLFPGHHIWPIFCQWNRITFIVIRSILEQQSIVECCSYSSSTSGMFSIFIIGNILRSSPCGNKDRVFI